VLTISEFSRSQLLSFLHLPKGKVSVTHLAAQSACLRQSDLSPTLVRLGVRQPYLIAFSGGSPNKNIPRLIQAFSLAQKELGLEHQLVLVGHKPPDVDRESASAMGEQVRFTGYIDEHAKQVLLAGAEFLVFPSTYEGFGLPLLEAMSLGTPVACSTAGSLPEIAGSATLFFNPYSLEDMAQKIGQMARDPVLRAERIGKTR